MSSLKLPSGPISTNDSYCLTPAGEYLGVLVDVVDLGWIENKIKDGGFEVTPWMKLVFQLDSLSPNGTRYKVSCRFEANFVKEVVGRSGEIKDTETKLHRILRQWDVIDVISGDDGTPIWDNLIGINGMVQVDHSINRDGNETAYFSRVLPVDEDTLEAEPYNRVCDREDMEPPEYSAFDSAPLYQDEDNYEEEE